MSDLVLQSEQQIVGGMARSILANTGLNDLNPGSILLTLLQAAAREDFAQYYQMLQIVRNYNLDTTTGSDLDNRAFEYGLTRNQALSATGLINILQAASFVEVSTSFFIGIRAAISGDTVIYVNNATGFPTSGSAQTLVIGRGTPNEEEVQYSPSGTNPQNFISYYQITLSTPLVNDHSQQETIILKQGSDILIPAGTIVQVPASGSTPQITFQTTVDATILAGDAQVDGVNVEATQAGSVGNIGVNSITGTGAFISPPFSGAQAANTAAFSNGQDLETDTSLRSRIRSAIQGINQSTQAGISNAIIGLVDPTTAKRVVSANILLPDSVGLPVDVYIDDGTGFEPDFSEQGEEIVIASALGRETRLQLRNFPLVKAQVETLTAGPYNMSSGELTLTVQVGYAAETINFFPSSFAIPAAGTALEIVQVINSTSTLMEARTGEVGTLVVITPKADTNDFIRVTGGTANSILDFPTEVVNTLYLYKNDQLLSKDGSTAQLVAGSSEPYNFSGSTKTLTIIVDGKSANTQTGTIAESDFSSPSAAASATADEVAAILNSQIAGAEFVSLNGALSVISNTTLSSSSELQITGGTANAVLNFSTSPVFGTNSDYILNEDLGVIQLNTALVAGDSVTAGTANTRGFLIASIAQLYTFVGGETLVIKIDGGSNQTITFTAAANQTAASVASTINAQLVGGTALANTSGSNIRLEIRTNTFSPSEGSIEILSSSTSNAIFGFTTNTIESSIIPHTAYVTSNNSGPYAFVQGNTLVVVMDNNNGETFIVTMNYPGTITSGSSTTVMAASGLTSVFPTTGELIDFWMVFSTGANTLSASIQNVANPTGITFKYFYKNPAPAGFQAFAVGDQVSFTNMNSAVNDGFFLVTGITTIATVHSPVINNTTSNPSALTPTTGDRYLIAAGANTVVNPNPVIDLNVSNPSALTPTSGDRHIVAPAANNVTLPDVKGLYTDSNDVHVVETNGFRYIINGVGTNAWAGHNNEIAQYNGVGTPGWIFIVPSNGDVVYDENSMHYYQFSSGSGTWIENDWGGKAGQIALWTGSAWAFTIPTDQEVVTVTSLSELYQYSVSTNLWTQNAWGGNANNIAQWTGSAWAFETAVVNDTVFITALSTTYQYNGATWSVFTFWVEVSNPVGIVEATTASGVGSIGQRRQLSAWNGVSGSITVSSAFGTEPSGGDTFQILPGNIENVVNYFNNTRVTSLTSSAAIDLVNQATQIQISSLQSGSDGYVQVTGGKANTLLEFSNTLIQGLAAYDYYTGLIKLVSDTIYGDETDLTTYPGVGATGVKFKILPPLVQEVSFSISIGLASGNTLSNVSNDVQTAVTSYVNSLGIGQEVVLAAIIENLMAVQGVIDVQIATPSANVVVNSIELARTKASLITLNVLS